MKKSVSMIIIIVMLFVLTISVYSDDSQLFDYDLYYPQFVDSKEPLSLLEQRDYSGWSVADTTHPLLSEAPDEDRIDCFDIAYGSDQKQKLDIHQPKGKNNTPVVFFIHGGGWVKRDKDHSRYAAPTWVSLGYTVVSINYRLAPQNPYPAQIEDCAMALKWVMNNIQKYGGDPNRISIVGHSSGGHLAGLLVTGKVWHRKYGIDISNVKCWITLAGIFDLNLKENYYHPSMKFFINEFIDNEDNKVSASPINHVSGDEPPGLIVHGGDDFLVPKTNSIDFYNKLWKRVWKTELAILNGYWHCNLLVNYGEPGHKPTEMVNDFLARYISTAKNCKDSTKKKAG